MLGSSSERVYNVPVYQFHTIQGTSQIALLIGHIRQNDVNGKLALACLDTAQLIAGVSAPFLEHPSLSYSRLKDPWLDSHQSFLTECDAKLIISCAWTPTLHRAKDRLIMEVAEKSSTKPIDRRHVNQCRKYLKVQRLSDLCNGAGTEFLPKALSHTYPSHSIESNLAWPRQGDPSKRAWATWKRILRRLFLADKAGPLRSLVLSKSDLTAPAQKNLHWLATSRTNSTSHQPRFPRLLPLLLGQKRNLRRYHAMPRQPSRRAPLFPT
jgi:hypothetical protein